MNLKSRNKIGVSFHMSGMTDIVFLLLIFFMLTSTLIAPNALKLLFPQRGQTINVPREIPVIELQSNGNIWLDGKAVQLENLENQLASKLQNQPEPSVTLICDRNSSVKESVRIMNIAAKNNYKLVLKEKQ